MNIIPLTLRKANIFIRDFHRHSKQVVGCRFCIGAEADGELIGVAVIGRPVARKIDQQFTAEIVRTCTNGRKNVNSFLYGAAWRIWKEMGGKRIITYTLDYESGASLKGAGFVKVSITKSFKPGKGWTTRKNREWQSKVHSHPKTRWEKWS